MLSDQLKTKYFKIAFQIRRVEELFLEYFSTGKISGTVHTCLGQEFVGVILGNYLGDSDFLVSNHRGHGHGHFLGKTENYYGLIAEVMGKETGVCRGHGGSQHLFYHNFLSSGIQGGMGPTALGKALYFKKNQKKSIVVICWGDGTLGEGVVYECFNIAQKLKLPIVFIIENNNYSQSTAQAETLSGSIANRAKAFNLEYRKSSTFCLEELDQKMQEVLDFAKSSGPILFEIETYRLEAHSKGDDYRDKEEIELYRKKDLLSKEIREKVFLKEDIQKKLSAKIEKYFDLADKDNFDKNLDQKLKRQEVVKQWNLVDDVSAGMMVRLIREGLDLILSNRSDSIFIGEDIRDPYGGTFKVSKGLSGKFPDRVLNMPISEACIVGMSAGYGFSKGLMISEIMFGDFIFLAFDQIYNHLSQFPQMFGRELELPLIIRAAMGGGKGYGATHSQSLEKYIYSVVGINLFLLHSRIDAKKFYQHLGKSITSPTFVAENKNLYSFSPDRKLPIGYINLILDDSSFTHWLRPLEQADITLIPLGGTSLIVENILNKLFDEDILIDVLLLCDMNKIPVIEIVGIINKSKKIIFIEEGGERCSISKDLYIKMISFLSDVKIDFIFSSDLPIPASKKLEKNILISEHDILEKIIEMLDE